LDQHKKSAPLLSLQEVITLLDPTKPLTSLTTRQVLEFVGINETMLLRINSLPDVNERLNFIRSLLLMGVELHAAMVHQIVSDETASGQVRAELVGVRHLSSAVELTVLILGNNTLDTMDPTKIH
jgi:hypothetical protein